MIDFTDEIDAEFVAKMSIVIGHADESAFWLELIADAGLIPIEDCSLRSEANELVAIFNASRSTARKNQGNKKPAA